MRGPRHTWHSWLAADRRKRESRVDISWDGEPSATGASHLHNRFKIGIVGGGNELLADSWRPRHLECMDPITRLNAAVEGRYRIERETCRRGEGWRPR